MLNYISREPIFFSRPSPCALRRLQSSSRKRASWLVDDWELIIWALGGEAWWRSVIGGREGVCNSRRRDGLQSHIAYPGATETLSYSGLGVPGNETFRCVKPAWTGNKTFFFLKTSCSLLRRVGLMSPEDWTASRVAKRRGGSTWANCGACSGSETLLPERAWRLRGSPSLGQGTSVVSGD
jgi:hypothetical protein